MAARRPTDGRRSGAGPSGMDAMAEIAGDIFLVLIPKSKAGEFRGIALLKIIYKLISSIINQRLFREKRGTGTAIMEAKLLAQLR